MRVIFMGTPDFAVPALVALVEAGHQVVAAYSQPPRPAGRGKQLQPSPVQRQAEARGIPVRYPVSLKGAEEQAEFAALNADIAVVAAYGLILPRAILAAPRHGCLNIHASLLPRWRGAAPIQRAVLAGDAETGVCIMRMEAGLDTGPVLLTGRTSIDRKTAGELTAELAEMGASLMLEVLADLPEYPEVPQPEQGVTYASKVDKAEARLDFSQSAEQVERQVRAFAPAPGAFFELEGERYRVLAADIFPLPRGGGDLSRPDASSVEAPGPRLRGGAGFTLDDKLTIACGSGAIQPVLIQRAGRPVMETQAFLRGKPIPAGTVLG
ncbi:MAG: methionyl-tRNA formyltransferase [Sphingomonadales bacterium]|nr:methionyl-tRNA formyltransferase [Sphingomonadales bacterium]